MADYDDEISRIEEILNQGAERVTKDGVTVQYNLESLRKRLAYLTRADEDEQKKRPACASIDLSNY